MKIVMKLLIASMFLISCKKDEPAEPIVSKYGAGKGQVTLWSSRTESALYPIVVKINNQTVGTISSYLTSRPDCDVAVDKVLKYINLEGSYNVYVTTSNGGSWSGSADLTSGSCYSLELK